MLCFKLEQSLCQAVNNGFQGSVAMVDVASCSKPDKNTVTFLCGEFKESLRIYHQSDLLTP